MRDYSNLSKPQWAIIRRKSGYHVVAACAREGSQITPAWQATPSYARTHEAQEEGPFTREQAEQCYNGKQEIKCEHRGQNCKGLADMRNLGGPGTLCMPCHFDRIQQILAPEINRLYKKFDQRDA
jgi:hypothetical protein